MLPCPSHILLVIPARPRRRGDRRQFSFTIRQQNTPSLSAFSKLSRSHMSKATFTAIQSRVASVHSCQCPISSTAPDIGRRLWLWGTVHSNVLSGSTRFSACPILARVCADLVTVPPYRCAKIKNSCSAIFVLKGEEFQESWKAPADHADAADLLGQVKRVR